MHGEVLHATHSKILAWRIPQTEELGRLYSPWGRKSQTRLSDQTTKPTNQPYALYGSKLLQFEVQ